MKRFAGAGPQLDIKFLRGESYVFMAFAAAESEDLGVIADKSDAFRGICWAGAEVARFNPWWTCLA